MLTILIPLSIYLLVTFNLNDFVIKRTELFLCLLFLVLLGSCSVALKIPVETEIDTVEYSKVISVNGYYVDDFRRVVTEDNWRITLDDYNQPVVLETDLTEVPYIKKYRFKTKGSLWSINTKDTTNYYLIYDWQYRKEEK